MSDLRTRFETIFNQYGCWQPDGGRTYDTHNTLGLLDALVAAVPTVRREAIVEVLRRYRFDVYQLPDDLLALWSLSPMWCEHMIWKDDKQHLRGWYYVQFQDQALEETWNICPICATPRPTA